jgi:hypothetical protein
MSKFSKIAGAATVLAISATSVFALPYPEDTLPSSLTSSRLVQSGEIASVNTFSDHIAPAKSLTSSVVNDLVDGQTVQVTSSLDGNVPAALANTRLLEN